MLSTTMNKDPHIQERLQEVEELIGELKNLLARKIDSFEDENIHREVDVLERWKNCYHKGLVSAEAFFETSTVLLATLHDRLKLAADEIHRLESEGGPAATKEQAEKVEELHKVTCRVEAIMNEAAAHAA